MKKTNSLTTILIGDTLGELATRLAAESGGDIDAEAKLLVVMINDNGVLLAQSKAVSRVEAAGALQIAYDLVLNK